MIVVVCSAVVRRENKFLFVKEVKPSAKGKWSLPGGKLEAGESIIDCLRREVLEETGFSVTSEHLIRIVNKPYTHEGNTVVKFIFSCTVSNTPSQDAGHEYAFLTDEALRGFSVQGLIRGEEIMDILKDSKTNSSLKPSLQIIE